MLPLDAIRRSTVVRRLPLLPIRRDHSISCNKCSIPCLLVKRRRESQTSQAFEFIMTRVVHGTARHNYGRVLFVSADGNLLPGRPEDGMMHGPFQGFHGLIDTILSSLQAGTVGGGFNPGDYVWGQNGLDDILTQLLQQVEGGAPAASRDDLQRLNPEPFKKTMRENNSQCSVCLCDFEIDEEVIQLPNCKHIFHPPCVLRWLEMHDSCPICRTPLRGSSNSTATTRNSTSSTTTRSTATAPPIPSASSSHSPRHNNWQDIIEEEDLD